jgi:hypothetical protein
LPYCELSFWHIDPYRVTNYYVSPKTGLRFKESVPQYHTVKPWFCPNFAILRKNLIWLCVFKDSYRDGRNTPHWSLKIWNQ